MSDVLVLNRDFTPLSFLPVSIVPWQLIMKAKSLDKVEIIRYHSDWTIGTVNGAIPVPSIAVINTYAKWGRSVRFNRHNVYLRDDFTCQYCFNKFNEKDLTLDHVLPRSMGGATSWTNITTSCKSCNHNKGNDETVIPASKPFVPDYYYMINKKKQDFLNVKDPEWLTYLKWPIKNTNLVMRKQNG